MTFGEGMSDADLVAYGMAYLLAGMVAEAEAAWLLVLGHSQERGQSSASEQAGSQLVQLYMQQGRRPEAMRAMRDAIVTPLGLLWRELIGRRQLGREQLIRQHRTQVDRLLSNLLGWFTHEEAATTALDLMLWRRGFGLEPYRAANRAARRDSTIKDKVEAVKLARAAMSAGLFTYVPEPRQRHRTELYLEGIRKSQEIDRLEYEIFAQLTEDDCAGALRPPDCAAVAARLPADGALIVYYRCLVTDAQNNQSPRYLAMVLRPGDAPQASLLDLGDAAPIDACVRHFQMALLGLTSDEMLPRGAMRTDVRGSGPAQPPPDVWRTAGRELRALVTDPLATVLKGVGRLFIVPDGWLTRLSFATLPTDDGFLLDRYTISYLTSGRELCEEWEAEASPPVVVAAPDYNSHGAAPVPDPSMPFWFGDLPGSRVEGEQVAERMGVKAISGPAATKRYLTECHSPVVLHISTHGTLLPAVPRIAEITLNAPWDPTVEMVGTVALSEGLGRLTGVEIEDQALRSMLVTAGINTWLAGGELPEAAGNGWLNAEDIAQMDLSGTQLVVLSACETGLGSIEIGEAVLGVRNAFSVAGARTIVSTLWQVQDELVTPELMLAFYDALADGTTGSAVALHGAQVAARRRYPNHPDWWGPFICHGGPGRLTAGLIGQAVSDSSTA